MGTALKIGILCSIILLTSACANVRFNERERLADPIMTFDSLPLQAEMQGHMFTPREGSMGGFSAVGAGGCGCN